MLETYENPQKVTSFRKTRECNENLGIFLLCFLYILAGNKKYELFFQAYQHYGGDLARNRRPRAKSGIRGADLASDRRPRAIHG